MRFGSVASLFVVTHATSEDSASLLSLRYKLHKTEQSVDLPEVPSVPQDCTDYVTKVDTPWKDKYLDDCDAQFLYNGICLGYDSGPCGRGSFCADEHGDDGYFGDQTCCTCGRQDYLIKKRDEAQQLRGECQNSNADSICNMFKDALQHLNSLLNIAAPLPVPPACTLASNWNAGTNGEQNLHEYSQCLFRACEDGLQYALSTNAQGDSSMVCATYPDGCNDEMQINDWGFTFKDLCPNFCSNGNCVTSTTTTPAPKACTIAHTAHIGQGLAGTVVQHDQHHDTSCIRGYSATASTVTCNDGQIGTFNCEPITAGPGKVVVTVVSATNLHGDDWVSRAAAWFGNNIDPYVNIKVCGDANHTNVVISKRKPIWDAQFNFNVGEACDKAEFEVMDYDGGWWFNPDDVLGETEDTVFRTNPYKPVIHELELTGDGVADGQKLRVSLEWRPN